ncbi:MAG: transcriptional regulator TrmB, partial [Sphingobacteriia bacterium]|nr:transcriptional regulator TrmB [Sphingobacteriia bacterium]
MEIKYFLAQFDLIGKKADVYLAVLELGSGTVIEIARKSEIKRTTVYDILLDLEKSGLIYQTTKVNKRLFVAEDPEKLKKKLEEKERVLGEMLPQLRSLYNIKGIKPKIKFYEGKEGLRQVYSDTLNYGGE